VVMLYIQYRDTAQTPSCSPLRASQGGEKEGATHSLGGVVLRNWI